MSLFDDIGSSTDEELSSYTDVSYSSSSRGNIRGVNRRKKDRKSEKSKKKKKKRSKRRDEEGSSFDQLQVGEVVADSTTSSSYPITIMRPPSTRVEETSVPLYKSLIVRFDLSQYTTAFGLTVHTFEDVSLCFYHQSGGTIERYALENGKVSKMTYHEALFNPCKIQLDVDITSFVEVDECKGYAQFIGTKFHSKKIDHRFLGSLLFSCHVLSVVKELDSLQYYVSNSLEFLKKVICPYFKQPQISEERKVRILSAKTTEEFYKQLVACTEPIQNI